MELAHLFETEDDDRVARMQAVIAHGQIRYWLEANTERLTSRLTSIPSGPFAGGYMMRSELCDLDGDYPDLVVLFVPKQTTVIGGQYVSAGGFFRKQGKSYIVIPCLLAPNDPTHLSTRFGAGGKKPFIHEFMHYLMSKRTKARHGSAKSIEANDEAGYFNNADEMNAYYQEAAQDMIEVATGIIKFSPKHTREWAAKSTPELIAYVKKTFLNKDFIAHATPKTMRAIDKRLARFVETTIRPMLQKAVMNLSDEDNVA